jgi:hypothetical protein
MNIFLLKTQISSQIRRIPVPRDGRTRHFSYERAMCEFSPLLPVTEQDWLAKTAANHFRI